MSVTDRLTLNRREILQVAGAALTALGLAGTASLASASTEQRATETKLDKARVAFVICAGYGQQDSDRIKLVHDIVTTACPRIKFTTHTVYTPEEARALTRAAAGPDGYLVWTLGFQTEAVRAFTECDRPVVVVHDGTAGR